MKRATLVFLALSATLVISACSMNREIAVPGTYNTVFASSVNAALEANFGIIEANRDLGIILAEDEQEENELEISLEEQGYQILLLLEISGDSTSRSFDKFYKELKRTETGAKLVE